MNDKRVNQYLILPKQGQRKDTKLAVEYSEGQIAELLKQGYVIVNQDDFNKLIGNADGDYLIADDGTVYPKPAPTDAELLATAKPAKIAELKAERDSREVEPITYNGNSYDYDDKARERMRIAQQALSDNNIPNQLWTTYDNTQVELTVQDFKNINTLAAKRSGELHIHYNTLKQEVLACTTNEDVEKIEW